MSKPNINDKFDVLIVGAGTGGCAAGLGLAKKGLHVLIVETHKKEKIGDKICGDATSASYFKRAQEEYGVPISIPRGEAMHGNIDGFIIISPNRKHKYRIKHGGWIINRHKFGQMCIDDTLQAGCELLDNTRVEAPIIENDTVVGVKVRNKASQQMSDIRAKVVIDASGIAAVLRKQLNPATTFMDQKLLPTDVEYCYREIHKVKTEIQEHTMMRIYFDQSLAPSGYYWVFPSSPYTVNAGLGVEGGSGISAKKLFLDQVIKSNDVTFSGADFNQSTVLSAGGAFVPLRRAQDSLVWNGLILTGDSGCTVKPTDGGGIGNSILASAMAVAPIIEALESNDVSRKGPLWKYNVTYMRKQGYMTSPLTLVKRVIVKVSNDTINEIFDKQLLTQEDIDKLNSGHGLELSVIDKAKFLVKARGVVGFLNNIRKTMQDYEKAKELYLNYPDSVDGLTEWRKKLNSIYSKYY